MAKKVKDYTNLIKKYGPQRGIIYTFKFWDSDKFRVYFKRFVYVGNTSTGRINLYDVGGKYFTDMPASRFAYLHKYQCIKKEIRVVEEKQVNLKPVESKAPSVDEFYNRTLEKLENYSEETKKMIKQKHGIDVDKLREEIESYTPDSLPTDIIMTVALKLPV